jgi:exopolysaccharide production protein ExoQ
MRSISLRPAGLLDCSVEEVVVVGLLLLFLTHFYIPILDPVQSSLFAASSGDQTWLGECINLAIWTVAGTLMVRRYRLLLVSWHRLLWALALPLLAVLSAFWSQDAAITLRKSAFLLLTTAFGIYFARGFMMERQMQLICAAGGIAAMLSILFALLLPAYGIDHDVHQGVWLGIFTQKNVCAREMLFLLASVLPFEPKTKAWRVARRVALVTIVAVVIGTQSKTALLIMGLICFIFPAIRLLRRLDRGLLLAGALGVCALAGGAVVFAASAMPRFIDLLGRDSTMTGRTDIWKAVLQAIFKHPLLGYGFAAFWLSLRGESANIILALRWAVPAAHNGFLDIWLQTGAIGLFLFAAGFLFACRTAADGLRHKSYARAAWPFAILLLTLVYNLDESSLLQPNDFLWVIYVTTLVNLSQPFTANAVDQRAHAATNSRHVLAV